MKRILLAALFLRLTVFLLADEVELRSGDRITGKIIYMDEETVTMEVAGGGKITVERKVIRRGVFEATAEMPTQGLVFAFLFDGDLQESSGDLWWSESSGGVTFTEGIDGRPDTAVYSTGSGSYITVYGPDSANEMTAFSLSLWIYPQEENRMQYLFSKWSSSSGSKAKGKLALAYRNADIILYIVDEGGTYRMLKASEAAGLESWSHVVATCEEGKLSLHVDGTLVAEAAYDFHALCYDESPILLLTARANTTDPWSYYNFHGKIDDLRLYSRKLDAAEIQTLYRGYP